MYVTQMEIEYIYIVEFVVQIAPFFCLNIVDSQVKTSNHSFSFVLSLFNRFFEKTACKTEKK